jgi:hypothetical protein
MADNPFTGSWTYRSCASPKLHPTEKLDRVSIS